MSAPPVFYRLHNVVDGSDFELVPVSEFVAAPEYILPAPDESELSEPVFWSPVLQPLQSVPAFAVVEQEESTWDLKASMVDIGREFDDDAKSQMSAKRKATRKSNALAAEPQTSVDDGYTGPIVDVEETVRTKKRKAKSSAIESEGQPLMDTAKTSGPLETEPGEAAPAPAPPPPPSLGPMSSNWTLPPRRRNGRRSGPK